MTIDGKDVYTEWGCKLLEGSFEIPHEGRNA